MNDMNCNKCGEPYVGLAMDCRCTNYGAATTLPARPNPSPGMFVGRIEFGPAGPNLPLTTPPLDGRVGIYVPPSKLIEAANMLDWLAATLDPALKQLDDAVWTADQVRQTAKVLRGQK